MPQTSASLGQSAAWATLVGHSGLVVDAGDDDCWVTTIEDEQTPANRGYLVIACVRFHTELRPLLDLYLWIAGKTFQWLDGEASVAGVSVKARPCMAGQRWPSRADWLRLLGARGSLGHGVALKGASDGPAGRRLSGTARARSRPRRATRPTWRSPLARTAHSSSRASAHLRGRTRTLSLTLTLALALTLTLTLTLTPTLTLSRSEPSTWEISGASTVVVHCFAQAAAPARLPMHADAHLALTLSCAMRTQPHELTFSRFRLEFESREFVVSNAGNASTDNAVLHRGYLKH